jgi:ABC-type antimicrobial peptide transport system permease subunit
VGVVKDFVFTSPFQRVEPIALFGSDMEEALNEVYIKLNPVRDSRESVAVIEAAFKKYNPEYPFEFFFADAEYQKKFENVSKTLTLTTIFTSGAIFIACLGLFGLAIYMTEARVKEIGVRKVLGGSVISITRLLGLSSLKPIVFALIVFTPLSYLSMSWWLESFAYRTTLDVWIFVTASLSILLIAVLTISGQTLKASLVNPVDVLKNE